MNECCKVNFNGFSLLREYREQRTLCRDHVNRNTVHAWTSLLMSWLSESGVLNSKTCYFCYLIIIIIIMSGGLWNQRMNNGPAVGSPMRSREVPYAGWDQRRMNNSAAAPPGV